MIVSCPACATRFRLDREKLVGKRLTLRCARCRKPFKVELPRASEDVVEESIRVMVAHSDRDLCATIRELLESAGMSCMVGHDGGDVLMDMQQTPPQVAVVDVALRGLYAFEVVDKVRRHANLANVKIILLSSVYNKMAYKRSPNSLYGADDYIEKHHIPDDLIPKINRLIVGAAADTGEESEEDEAAAGQEFKCQETPDQSMDFIKTVNQRILTAENQEFSSEDLPEIERARRLARIIVSDISLYSQDRVDEGIRSGNWSELLASEIREARNLFNERFPSPEVQQHKVLETAFIDLFEKRRRELES